MSFDHKGTQALADKIVDLINESKLPVVERVYAVCGVLHSIGASLYDKPELIGNKTAIENDYRVSPTWGAGLILMSYLAHDLREMFVVEKINPEKNKKEWALFEDKLKGRIG